MELPPPESVILFDPDFALGLTYFISPFVKRPLDLQLIPKNPGGGTWEITARSFSAVRT